MSAHLTAKSVFTALASKSPTSTTASIPFFTSLPTLPPTFLSSYTTLTTNVFERRRLQLIDQGGEKKLGAAELTRLSAARSGFHMPMPYDEKNPDANK